MVSRPHGEEALPHLPSCQIIRGWQKTHSWSEEMVRTYWVAARPTSIGRSKEWKTLAPLQNLESVAEV